MDKTRDRALGAMVGLAVGDAIGTTLEFSKRDTYPHVTDMVGGGPFNLLPGQWTDDTSMAICLAESLLHDPYVDKQDLLSRFLRWRDEGENSSTGACFDIGNSTNAAISLFKSTGTPPNARALVEHGGNGSIMRLAPVALRWWRQPLIAYHVAANQSSATHNEVSADVSSVMAWVLATYIAGNPTGSAPDELLRSIERLQLVAPVDRSAVSSSGYVLDTYRAALWALASEQTFEATVLAAANLGDDADTVAAVAGQMAGALYGLAGIPERWVSRLHDSKRIQHLAQQLYEAGA